MIKRKEMEEIKEMSREERDAYFESRKEDIQEKNLDDVNGNDAVEVENPDSKEIPYKGNWWSSFGYVCNGIQEC